MINYSFIIPHKNTPDLLRKCIDSIPHRDDVQIIVVDDKSDIDKVDFKTFPGLNEQCTEVYLTKEGRGAGFARNIGLEHAIGTWIVFADADDFFYPSIEDVMNMYVDSCYDIVFFGGDSIKIPSGEFSARAEAPNEALQIALETNDFSDALITSTPWRKLLKRRFLQRHDIKFNEVRWSNDIVFSAKVALYVRSCAASNISAYCTTESSCTLTKDCSLECRICRLIEECKEVKMLKSRYDNIDSLFYWLFQNWLSVYNLNKISAFKYLPYCIYCGGFKFVNLMIKTKLHK